MDVDFDLGGDELSAFDALELLVPFDGKFEFDTTTNIAKFGKKIVDATKIDDARLHVDPTFRSRNLALIFGVRGDLRLILPLRRKDADVVRDDVRTGVIAMLEVSSIVIPATDEFDPKGKFARSAWPTHVTRSEAIALVRNPPMPGDKLPIIWP